MVEEDALPSHHSLCRVGTHMPPVPTKDVENEPVEETGKHCKWENDDCIYMSWSHSQWYV